MSPSQIVSNNSSNILSPKRIFFKSSQAKPNSPTRNLLKNSMSEIGGNLLSPNNILPCHEPIAIESEFLDQVPKSSYKSDQKYLNFQGELSQPEPFTHTIKSYIFFYCTKK